MDEVNDPWFNATAFVGYLEAQPYVGSTGRQPEYFSNQPVSSLGCTTQHQFCTAESNPSQRQCTEMLGQYMPDIAQSKHFADHSSSWGWAYFFAFRLASNIDDVVERLGVLSLLARKRLTKTFQGQLPDNQWQLEVEHWHAVSMASLQASFVTVATGPSDDKMANSAWWLRDSEANWSGCRRQVSHMMQISHTPKILHIAVENPQFGIHFILELWPGRYFYHRRPFGDYLL